MRGWRKRTELTDTANRHEMERYARIEASERAESMSSPRVSRERIHFFRPVMVGTTRRVRSLVTLAAHAVLVCARADAYSLFISSLQVLLQPAQCHVCSRDTQGRERVTTESPTTRARSGPLVRRSGAWPLSFC